MSINGKKKFKRILVEGEKFKFRKLPSKDFIALFSSRRRVCTVLKHKRVSEVFKGSKEYGFDYYGESLEYFAILSRFHSRGPTHDSGSVTQAEFKYKLTGFRINFFQKWFLCPLFGVCLFITVGLSTVAGQLHKLCFQF